MFTQDIARLIAFTLSLHFFFAVHPSAIVTVYGHKGKVKDMLQGCPNLNAVTVFLAEVPKNITLPSDSEYKMVDLGKVSNSMCCYGTHATCPGF